jgi:hypothetical protein
VLTPARDDAPYVSALAIDADSALAPMAVGELTPPQAGFALRVGAHPGLRGAAGSGNVFLYRSDQWGTERWLVDRQGLLIDAQCFQRSA